MHNNQCENELLSTIAQKYGTPCYVYSKQKIIENYQQYQRGFADRAHLICYSVKANSNLSILKILADLGCGFDIVSGGELARVLAIGADSSKIVFSGVGKSYPEIKAALKAKIGCFNVESFAELQMIEKVAQELNLIANVSIRVNPDIDAKTHPYISTGLKDNKFGIAIEQAFDIYQHIRHSNHLQAIGIDCHIGSQLSELQPFISTIEKILSLAEKLEQAAIKLKHLDFGGGLGINYSNEEMPSNQQLAKLISQLTAHRPETIIIEPGRSLVGNAGVLLTKVEYLKENGDKNFCIVDAAMNDLIRPALYQAWQEISPLTTHSNIQAKIYDVVGPICETSDFLGRDRNLAILPGDILAIRQAGAYCFSMSSNYNSRARAAEVLIDGKEARLIRARETLDSLYANEMQFLDQ